MKTLRFLLSGALALVTLFTVQAQTADEVIDKHLQAIGGKEKLLTLTSVVMECNLSVQGMDIPIKITQLNNKGQRVDITAMGMENYTIQTNTDGWTYMPIQGQTAPQAMPAEAVKESVDLLDIQGALLNYKDKGHKVEYLGKEDVEGTECHKLKIALKGGMEQTMYFDPASYYIVKVTSKSKATGQEVEQTQTFSNFKKLDEGFVFPFALTGFGPGELTISKITVNQPVDEKIFKVQ